MELKKPYDLISEINNLCESISRLSKKRAYGKCFEWAYKKIVSLYKEDSNTDARLVHAMVFNPSWNVGEREWIEHAWVENKITNVVWDWQNFVVRKKGGIALDKYYLMNKPKNIHRYTGEMAIVMAVKHKNFGPWEF